MDAPWKGVDLLPTFSVLWAANVSVSATFSGMLGRPRARAPTPWSRCRCGCTRPGRSITAPDYLLAVGQLQAFSRGVVGFFDNWDVLITPSLAKLPVRHGEIDPMGDNPAFEFKKSGEFTPYTAGMNVTGQPAISLPLRQSEEGLPLGTQLIGRPRGRGHAAGAVRRSWSRPGRGRIGSRRTWLRRSPRRQGEMIPRRGPRGSTAWNSMQHG